MSYDAPFDGLKVIDLSQGLAAPYCAMLLAQAGANVIKVEPISGDWSRLLGTTYGDQSAFSIAANLAKRSIALDLKPAAGKQVLWRLIEGADVIIEGFRPGVMERLGFGYAAVAAREPRIIYLSVSGFGSSGPLATRPAMDPVLQAYTGLTLDNAGADGIPRRVPISIVDLATGLYSFHALAVALYARRDETRGRHIETSLLGAAAAFQSVRLIGTYLDGGNTPVSATPAGSFQTRDGWIQLQVVKEADWVSLCGALDIPQMATDPRFVTRAQRVANRAALYDGLRRAFSVLSMKTVVERFTAAELLYEQINTHAEFLNQPHVAEAQTIAWLAQSGVPVPVPVPNLPGVLPFESGTPRATAPSAGQHTAAILQEHGFDAAEIADLYSRGLIGASAEMAA